MCCLRRQGSLPTDDSDDHFFRVKDLVPDKTEDTLWYAFRDRWLTVLGTPETVVTDGEAALATSKNRNQFAAHNIKLSVRAPAQHAHFAERHGAMLRHVVHVLSEQLKIRRKRRTS